MVDVSVGINQLFLRIRIRFFRVVIRACCSRFTGHGARIVSEAGHKRGLGWVNFGSLEYSSAVYLKHVCGEEED